MMKRVSGMLRFASRWLGRVVLALSLVSFVVTCTFWVRSRRAAEWVWRESDDPRLFTSAMIYSSNGLILIDVGWRQTGTRPSRTYSIHERWVKWKHGRNDERPNLRVVMKSPYDSWGFGFAARHSPGARLSSLRWSDYRILFPHWAAALLFGIPPLALIRPLRAFRRTRRRARRGLCLACGYDLRATPGRCPECGTPAPAPARPITALQVAP